jgi:hypothetical protein
VALATLALAQGAWAIGGNITARFDHDTEDFRGKVSSPDRECRAHRVVKVYEITEDGRSLQGRARTNERGGWTIHVMDAEGLYVAIAPRYQSMHGPCDRLASDQVDVM